MYLPRPSGRRVTSKPAMLTSSSRRSRDAYVLKRNAVSDQTAFSMCARRVAYGRMEAFNDD